ncbi:MAG: DUF1638 domain-containing protein [Anaerolineae bacterium]|jgi:hypothetical protein|nr:DUF1638 domain-containing protein [Anaerolineae bacterium]
MKLKCISCEALARILYYNAASSPHTIDIDLFELGLHNEPAELQKILQHAIDSVAAEKYDAIVLGYGLCGKATQGIAARDMKIVVPRAHDCITLFLGSRARYQQEFEEHTGTYWYAADYIERTVDPNTALSLGASTMGNVQEQYDQYVEKYGEDNAKYLMEVMGGWEKHYNRAAYINYDFYPSPVAEGRAQQDAQKNDWSFDRVAGNLVILKKLLYGEWDDDFLVLQPGESLEMSNDEHVIRGKNGLFPAS